MSVDYTQFVSGSPDQNATVQEARAIQKFRIDAGLKVGVIVAIQHNAAQGDAQELSLDQIGTYKDPLYLQYKSPTADYESWQYENVGLNRVVIRQCEGDAILAATRLFDMTRDDMAESSGARWDVRQSPVAVEAAGKALAKSLPKF